MNQHLDILKIQTNKNSPELKPLVSIVIPCFNHEKFINSCIKSLINQDYQNIELIVIDDGSYDSSVNEINKISHECLIRFTRFEFRHRKNLGLCATLNEAIEWCKGEFYSVLASDDLYLPNKISYQLSLFHKHHDILAVFGSSIIINEVGEKVKIAKSKSQKFSFNEILMNKANLQAPTMLAKFHAIKKIYPFPVDIGIEDRYTQLALTKTLGGTLLSDKNPVVCYRRHFNNSSLDVKSLLCDNIKLINRFADVNQRKQAISNILLGSAISISSTSRREAFGFFLMAFNFNKFIFFELKFIYFLIKIFGFRRI